MVDDRACQTVTHGPPLLMPTRTVLHSNHIISHAELVAPNACNGAADHHARNEGAAGWERVVLVSNAHRTTHYRAPLLVSTRIASTRHVATTQTTFGMDHSVAAAQSYIHKLVGRTRGWHGDHPVITNTTHRFNESIERRHAIHTFGCAPL